MATRLGSKARQEVLRFADRKNLIKQKECIMSMIGIVLMWVFFVIGLGFLSWGPDDEESKHSQAYWARFEAK